MSKTLRLLVALVAALSLALTGCARQQPTSTESTGGTASVGKATIGLTYIPNIQFAPFYIAKSKNLYADAGADITLRHHGQSEGLFTALSSGEEQYVIAGGDEMMQARAQGIDAVAIAQYYRQYPAVLIVPDASPIKSIKDLAGHSVGVPGRFGESWFGLQVALKSAGLTEDDVQVNEIGYTGQAALSTGKVESIIGFSNNDQVQFQLAGVPTRTIPLVEDQSKLPLVSIVLITTRKNLDANPAQAKAVAQATIEGMKAAKDNPADAIEVASEYVPTLKQAAQQTAAKATLEATTKIMADDAGVIDGRLEADRWSAMADFMLQQGLIEKAVDGAQAIDTGVLG